MVVAVVGEGDAHAGPDGHLLTREGQGLDQGVEHPLGHRSRPVGGVERVDQDGELVAAQPGDGVGAPAAGTGSGRPRR